MKVIKEGVITLAHHKPKILHCLKDLKVDTILKMAKDSTMQQMEFKSYEKRRKVDEDERFWCLIVVPVGYTSTKMTNIIRCKLIFAFFFILDAWQGR